MLHISSQLLQDWVIQLLWPLTRILGCIAVAPIFSHKALPKRVKLGLGMMITLAVLPTIETPHFEVYSITGLFSLISQFLIGMSMGFVMRVVFAAIDMMGYMVGMSMGLGFATFYDAENGGQSMAISQFLDMLALLVFLSLDGHLMVIATLAQSFQTMPITTDALVLNSEMIAKLGSFIFNQGLLLSLPVVATLLVTNMALGILTKTAPQLNIFGIGFPITISIGLIMIFLSINTMVTPITQWIVHGQQMMLQVAR